MTHPVPRPPALAEASAMPSPDDVVLASLDLQAQNLRHQLRLLAAERSRHAPHDWDAGWAQRRAALATEYGDVLDELLATPLLTPRQKRRLRDALEDVA